MLSTSLNIGAFSPHADRWFQGLVQADLQRWVEVYVLMVSLLRWRGSLTFYADIILATCDVEGNFLVVKVSPRARTLIFSRIT